MQISILLTKRKLEIIMAFTLLCVVTSIAVGINLGSERGIFLKNQQKKSEVEAPFPASDKNSDQSKNTNLFSNITIAIDPGHGGVDPGKVGINQQLEKDINLSIALKLEQQLLALGFQVIMTRREDIGLYQEQDTNKKRTDMKKRVELINNSHADLCVSIHQNSYTSENATGAQVFYYSKSEDGKTLANYIQKELIAKVDPSNKRVEKDNHNYYMLLHVSCPSVIIECGFLSNWREATNLADDYYQETIATAIASALQQYCSDS